METTSQAATENRRTRQVNPEATAHRKQREELVAKLVADGYIQKDAAGRFALTIVDKDKKNPAALFLDNFEGYTVESVTRHISKTDPKTAAELNLKRALALAEQQGLDIEAVLNA